MSMAAQSKGGNKTRRIFVLLIIFLIAVLGIFFYGQQRKAGKETQEPQPKEPTREEILQGLSAPSGGVPPTEEEKQEILEGLSAPAPPGTPPPTEEERRAILEALSKPQQ